MKHRGITTIELLVAAVLASVVMGGLFQAMVSMRNSFSRVSGITQTVVAASDTANTIAGAIRRSSSCRLTSGCNVNPGSAIAEGTPLQIVLFTDTRGNVVKYSNELGGIVSTVAGKQNVLAEDGELRLKYFRASKYNVSELQEFTPTFATLKNVIAVEVSISVSRHGVTDSHPTIVRLRNSPYIM